MKLLAISALLFGATLGFGQSDQEPQTDPYFLVVYVETVDTALVNQFLEEVRGYDNKIISANYTWESHEFVFTYTPLMRDDTIFQLIMQNFSNMKKRRGTFILETF